jgi:FAD/FMN-containing dehydrogenase
MSGVDRRGFFKQGARLAGGLAGAQLLSACGGSSTAGHRPADLKELSRALRGRTILPQSPGYNAARLVWDSRFDGARPLAVVQVADAADVSTVVHFARAHDLRLIVRSGGHSFAGYSTGDGLVVDLSALTAVAIEPGGEVARLGAGTTTLPTYRALWQRKMAISGGTCPTVGIPGLTCGGGLGVLSRRDGLTCDNLREVEIVTADGRLVRANGSENADLYWATRGGGGGNFGIITALTFGLVPVDMPFTHLEYVFPWSSAESVLAAWQDWLPGSPQKTWSAAELLTQAPAAHASPVVAIEVVHAGARAEADAVTAGLLHAIGVAPTSQTSQSGPFFNTEFDFYCKGLRPQECTVAGKTPAGKFPRAALYSKSDVASRAWPTGGLSRLIEWIEKRQRDRTLTPHDFSSSQTVGKVLIEAADGAVNSIAPDATAFVHRDNLFVAQYQARWRTGSPPEVVAANLDWADGLYAAVKQYRSGFAYQNYIDANLEGWEHAYYGANLARLREVKSKYDPDNIFRFAQSIPPA